MNANSSDRSSQPAPAVGASPEQLGRDVAAWTGFEYTGFRTDTGLPEQRVNVSVERLGHAVAAILEKHLAAVGASPEPTAFDTDAEQEQRSENWLSHTGERLNPPPYRATAAVVTEETRQNIIAEFLERTGQYVTNDASREAAIKEAVDEALAAVGASVQPVLASLSGTVRFDLPAEDCFTNDTGSYPMYHCMDCKASEYGTTKVEHKPGCRVAAALASSTPTKGGEAS